jgi:hypothetical protein
MKKLLYSILRWKTKQSRAKNKREVKFMDYDHIRSVLLLFESKDGETNYAINEIIRSLKKDGKNVVLCGFVNKKKLGNQSKNSYMLDLSALNILKEPKKEFIAPLLNEKFDIVIDLTLTNVLPLKYILEYTKAPFKAGRKTSPALDFMINIENVKLKNEEIDEKYLFEQIIFYLKTVKSH